MSRDTKLYDLLGVSPDADDSKIRSAYRKLAHKLHPDRNRAPDAKEQFQNVQRAYDILSDEHKRQLYDQFGEEGVERGGPPGMDGMGGMGMGGLFEQLFSQGGGRQRPSGPRRGRDVAHALPVSLEDLYRGKTSKLALKKSVLCGTCRGSGARAGVAEQTCASCRGQGVRVQVRQLGPMIQQVQMPCGDCNGQGTTLSARDRCPDCNGEKVVSERKVLEVHIDKGMADGTKITFAGEADQAPGIEPGDVVIVLQQKPHPVFKRDGSNLHMEQTVDLLTALAGGQFVVTHLDGRHLLVSVVPGEILAPGTVKVVPEEGFPTERTHHPGDLYIKFNVQFPTAADMTPEKFALLEQALPPRPPLPHLEGEVEEVVLADPDPNARAGASANGRRPGGATHDDGDDDDDPRGGPGVQCATQ
ncbi:Type I HSP40 co-chaperone [Allomyces javanicus]|nr:Type I HSP40 co-chaperone [Allomyces javanicus]